MEREDRRVEGTVMRGVVGFSGVTGREWSRYQANTVDEVSSDVLMASLKDCVVILFFFPA